MTVLLWLKKQTETVLTVFSSGRNKVKILVSSRIGIFTTTYCQTDSFWVCVDSFSQKQNIPLRKLAHAIHRFFFFFFFFRCKNSLEIFLLFFFFNIFAQNIQCGYTLEPPRRGGSNEYPHYMFWIKNKKIRYTPVYKSGVHQENISVQYIPPYTPLIYSKTGIRRGIPFFLIFSPKHRLWVLVRTASCTHNLCFEQK